MSDHDEADLLGRVNSLLDLPRVALAPLSIAGMGLLAAIDVRLAFVFAALPMLLVGLILGTNRRARQLTGRAADGAPAR